MTSPLFHGPDIMIDDNENLTTIIGRKQRLRALPLTICAGVRLADLCRRRNGADVPKSGTAVLTPQTQALAATLRQHRGRDFLIPYYFHPGGR
jgi:hypothetical protein